MKARTFLIAILVSGLLASCIDMTEELFLTKKGSGKYTITMDLSGIMDMANLAEMFGEENAPGEMSEPSDETAPKEDREEGFGGLFGEGEGEDMTMDTLINFYDDIKADQKQNLSNPEILKKGFMQIKMNEAEKVALMSFIVEFDKLSDINEFFNVLAETNSEEEKESLGGLGSMIGMSNGFGDKDLFSLSKRVLTRTGTPEQYSELLNGEDGEFAKMMFKGAKYTTIYHLPGRVKNTTIPNAVVKGKTITIENDFLDIIEEKVALDGQVKFKRR